MFFLRMQDGSNGVGVGGGGAHDIFLWRNVENYPLIIPVTPSYLQH